MNALNGRLRASAERTHPELADAWDELDGCWAIGHAPDGRRIAVIPLMYTSAVIIGVAHQITWYDDRWCYHTVTDALTAARAWDGTGEPAGWHNSPESQWRHVPGDVTATSPDVPEMKIFVLSADEIIRLSDMAANADRYGRTFRVAVDDSGVKFKVGEGTWTWAYGTKEEQS